VTTVLIVDDEALAIPAIRRSINWKNSDVDRVLDARNGLEAQRIFRRNRDGSGLGPENAS